MIGDLLMGRGLPCRDLYGKTTKRSCCDKTRACNKAPTTPQPKSTPCPLQQNLLALQKASIDAPDVQLAPAAQFALVSQLLDFPALILKVGPEPPVPHYTPPLLYVIHEQFLI